MRKLLVFGVMIAALSIPATAIAADLHDQHTGGVFSCPVGDEGTYHFVNNQTGGATFTGEITATFSSGEKVASAYMVLRNVQHFSVTATGSLLDASTDLPGRLVLSDFDCDKK